jgi:DNA-binding FrmR family transcriptional regulator
MPASKRPDPRGPRAATAAPRPRTDAVAVTRRLRRIEGQVRGLAAMVEDARPCVDVLTQISAVRSALDAVALAMLRDHARGCVRDAVLRGRGDAAIDELVDVLGAFAK